MSLEEFTQLLGATSAAASPTQAAIMAEVLAPEQPRDQSYHPRTPSPTPTQEEQLRMGRSRGNSTSSTPNSEVSALGERDAHFHEHYN